MSERSRGDWFVTYSGRRIFVHDPKPEDIRIVDIAQALSQLCRFGGHCIEFYSVAQHSVFVSHLVPEHLALEGLLHDAAEAYLGDVIRPLKQELDAYREIESRWGAVIRSKWALPERESPEVKRADLEALATERRDLLPKSDPHRNADAWMWVEDLIGAKPHPEPIKALTCEQARNAFALRYVELRGSDA